MLVDEVIITVKAGKGGDGAVHFKRNAQTAKGGPDGGNGGRGGNIYFQGINDITALQEFRYKKTIQAENGVNGGRQNLYGRAGKDTLVRIPIGTVITNLKTNQQLEIADETTKILMAKGGEGGLGNNEFKTATNQTPRYAETGKPGEEKTLQLELRLIADVGFIGLPNAGKSSLLKALTNAKPKIGAYPFTTLEPNLGVMQGIILADIPGLIEGASQGKGLGIKFLRHIEKTKLLVHCIACDSEHMLKDYKTIRQELAQYNPKTGEKPEIILLTKSDLVTPDELKKKIHEMKKINKKILAVSIYDKVSINKLALLLTLFIKNQSTDTS